MRQRFLRIYMNDQLALGIAWREVARRAQRSNDGTELGDALARVSAAIAEDVVTFEAMMRQLGISRNPVRPRPPSPASDSVASSSMACCAGTRR